MRILEIVADGKPGGGTSVVLDLAAGLAGQGHAVVVASAPDSYALTAAQGLGLDARPLDLWRGRFDPSVPARVRALVRETAPDLVHAHGGRAGLAVARAGIDRPFAYTVHGYHFPAKPWPLAVLGRLAERRIGRTAQAQVWICQADRDLALTAGLDQGRPLDRVIRNGIDPAGLPARRPAEPGLLAWLGRLVPQKNPAVAIELLARPGMQAVRLVMIGGGPLAAELQAQAAALGVADRLAITGELPRGQALERLAGAAALVLTSRWEGIPMALVEAMAIGVPVVASRVRGIPELVEDGQSGLLVDRPDDVDAYARAILRLTEPGLARRLVEAARATVEAHYHVRRMIDDHARLYAELVSATGC